MNIHERNVFLGGKPLNPASSRSNTDERLQLRFCVSSVFVNVTDKQ